MGSRYVFTGTQLGMLLAYLETEKYSRCKNLIDDIIKNQYLYTSDGSSSIYEEIKKMANIEKFIDAKNIEKI